MYRNLLGRVETVVPIENPPLRQRLWDILQLMLNDQRQAWDLHADGSYAQRTPTDPAKETGVHQTLMALARQQSALAAIELAGAI
jgi:polyphosphate kinase